VALSTHEILHRLEQNAPVIRRYGVRSLGLFGSGRAAREDSDLDFVVEFEVKSFDAYMDLKGGAAMTDDAPKSAYEIAMERLRQADREAGAAERPLTDEQRRAIAEVRKFHDAKFAEREILHQDAVKKAQSYDEIAKLNNELAQDRDRLARERDRKIADIRERAS
jgi:hypothetical protein